MHDHSGITLRHSVGVGNMLWSSDNPHHGNDWPYARKLISEMMADVDPSERQQLVAGNAARIYGLDKIKRSTAGTNGAVRVVPKAKAASRNGARASRNGSKAKASRNGARPARRRAPPRRR